MGRRNLKEAIVRIRRTVGEEVAPVPKEARTNRSIP